MEQEKYQKALGKKIASFRVKSGMSQKDVVKISGINETTISRIENGETNVTIGTLNKIAAALATTSTKLLP